MKAWTLGLLLAAVVPVSPCFGGPDSLAAPTVPKPGPAPAWRSASGAGGGIAPAAVAAPAAGAVPGPDLARTLSQITGVAISPLLGTAVVGAWRYLETPPPRRPALPWFAQPWFWVPALVLLAVVFAKDALGPATPTVLKKPMDVAEVLENKVSGLIAAGAFVPIVVGILGSELPGLDSADLSAGGMAAASASPIVNLLLTPFALIAFVAVWLLGHVINVLILISPFATVDAALKLARTTLLASVVGTSFLHPTLGALWALLIILVSILLAGWSFRLTVLGSVFLWDVLTLRRLRFRPDPRANWIFLARQIEDVPSRALGKLNRETDGALAFQYRPFLVGPRRQVVLPPGDYCVGRGLIYADLLKREGDDTLRVAILPPRYRGHADAFTRIYQLHDPIDVGWRAVWRCLKELLVSPRVPLQAPSGLARL